MAIDPEDAEIRAFIRVTNLPTYSLIAKVLVATFGPDRAWPVTLIRKERALHVRYGRRVRYTDNPAVMAFIRDHMDLASLDDLMTKGRAIFVGGFPSRSHLHRIISNLRTEAGEEVDGNIPRNDR